MNAPAPIKTPCVKVCVVDGETGLCLGCFRRLPEVAAWTRMTAEERERVLAELPERRALVSPEKLGWFN